MADQLAFGLHPAGTCELRFMWQVIVGYDVNGWPEYAPPDCTDHPSTGHAHLWPGLPNTHTSMHHHRCDGCGHERGHLGGLPCPMPGSAICWCDRRGPLPEDRSTPGGARKGEARGHTERGGGR